MISPALNKWLFQYKLLHVFMWVLMACIMLMAYYDTRVTFGVQALEAGVLTAIGIPLFYFAAYRLIPRLLYRHRFARYVLAVIGAVLASTVIDFFLCRILYHLATDEPWIPTYRIGIRLVNILIWDNIIAVAVASALKILSDRFRMERRLQEVEKEKISTELAFLRSQVNPHFLFNIMNTIYFQIHKENKTARESVEQLSHMLRYQLYECNTDKIEIHKELDYIRHYVAMQTLRLEKDMDIRLTIDEDLAGFRIAPLLILPLVENAFKHISHFRDLASNRIHIHLRKGGEGAFLIRVANTYETQTGTAHLLQSGGLGVQNLKRRLELLYPGRHTLDVSKDAHMYETTLKISYDD